jgi:hypothetical protein
MFITDKVVWPRNEVLRQNKNRLALKELFVTNLCPGMSVTMENLAQ